MVALDPVRLRLMAVTPGEGDPDRIGERVAAALRGGATAVLVREPERAPQVRESMLRAILAMAREAGALCLVSRDVELARRLRADGVHLGYGGPSVAQARAAGGGLLVGRSCHWPVTAEDAAADYVTLSPFGDVSKAHARPPLSAEQAASIVGSATLGPVVALGGLRATDVGRLPDGIAGVAAIRALFGAADTERAARELRRAIDAKLAEEALRDTDAPVERATEDAFIAWCTPPDVCGGLWVGPGDDAAVLRDGLVVTVDTFVEGVHFAPGTPPAAVARKAFGATLSDLCAMGSLPEAVLVSAQLPPGAPAGALARAIVHQARRHAVTLAGGDTVRTSPGTLTLALTAFGRVGPGGPWTRGGARPGDRLVVSGPLGGSGRGRHLHAVPRRDVVEALRAAGTRVHAALDLSDGLGRDLPRLTRASRVGALVDAALVPIHPDAADAPDPLLAALGDGEDFELLLALPPETPAPADLIGIGTITAGESIVLTREGRAQTWPPVGYQHVF